MPRPMWTGSIAFGLVNVPVKVYSAVHQKEVRFHQLHDKDGGRIQLKRTCAKCGKEVAYENIVKGYELSPGRYVRIAPEELEALDPKATRAIEIEDFVALDEIDPIYWESTYYLVPDKGADRAYALLLNAMERAKKVGIAHVVMRTKQYLCSIRPLEHALAMSTMLYADEIVSTDDLEELPKREAKPRDKELAMAEKLIDSLTGAFEPKKYKDDYREKVLELIEKKKKGEEIVVEPEVEHEKGGKVVDLMAALQASLGKKEIKGERRHRAEAAKTSRAHRRRK